MKILNLFVKRQEYILVKKLRKMSLVSKLFNYAMIALHAKLLIILLSAPPYYIT